MNEPFKLSVPASKSHLNRLLVLQSFNPLLRIVGESRADDVVKMRAGIDDLIFGREVDCGAAGTVLRFLAVRASRIPGQHRLRGTRRLFQRPQTELASLLAQLNCQVSFGPDLVQIRGDGWKIPRAPVRVDRSFSSQFASAVLLNSWDLPETLSVEFDGEIVSDSYFAMTFEVVKRAGLLVTGDRHIRVQPKSLIQDSCLEAEIDLSCAFSISAVAIARGRAVAFENWPTSSLQPDMVFVDILRRMGCTIEHEADRLTIVPTGKLRPINVDLGNAPDLFPVLAVLCAHADGESRLSGAPHLRYKESNRMEKTADLLARIGVKYGEKADGIVVFGNRTGASAPVDFDPAADHRMAMAAAVAGAFGAPIEIREREVVNKSFPEFWSQCAQL